MLHVRLTRKLIIVLVHVCSAFVTRDQPTVRTGPFDKQRSPKKAELHGRPLEKAGYYTTTRRTPKKAIQEERIEWRLDSLVLTIEGTGKDPVTQKVAFHAFAIINYNLQTKKLEMKSFTLEGR